MAPAIAPPEGYKWQTNGTNTNTITYASSPLIFCLAFKEVGGDFPANRHLSRREASRIFGLKRRPPNSNDKPLRGHHLPGLSGDGPARIMRTQPLLLRPPPMLGI